MLDARGHEGDSYIIIPPCGEVVMRGLVTVLLLGVASIALPGQEVDWSANGRDAQGTRYSPASEITRTNVNRLAVAWTYRTGETDRRFKTEKPTAFEADRKSTRLNSSHTVISYAVFCLKKKN